MKSFKLSDEYEVVCVSEGTRYGFRHLATLLKNGNEIDKAKICYYNRTWERYEFESVMKKIIAQNPELKEKLDILGVLNG